MSASACTRSVLGILLVDTSEPTKQNTSQKRAEMESRFKNRRIIIIIIIRFVKRQNVKRLPWRRCQIYSDIDGDAVVHCDSKVGTVL